MMGVCASLEISRQPVESNISFFFLWAVTAKTMLPEKLFDRFSCAGRIGHPQTDNDGRQR
jgi:hypothetical protein